MLDRKKWYAIYDEERDSFVVQAAGWKNDDPMIEYRLIFHIDTRTQRKLGAIDKIWYEGAYRCNDIYDFRTYPSKKAFEVDRDRMMTQARELAHLKQRDYFLCILDLVKARAVRAGREYASIKDYDELFDIGPEDAYRWLPDR